MEKETKIIKEKVKSSKIAEIESIAAAKAHEEIGEELMPLKSQLGAIQTALNQLESSGQQNMSSQQGQGQSGQQNMSSQQGQGQSGQQNMNSQQGQGQSGQ